MIGDIIKRSMPMRADVTGGEVYDRFSGEPDLLSIAMVDCDHRPIGLVGRTPFFLKFADRFGRALFEKRPAALLMDHDPVIVLASASLADVGAVLSARAIGSLLEGFIVTAEDGRYFGVGDGMTLLGAVLADRAAYSEQLALHNSELDRLLRLAADGDWSFDAAAKEVARTIADVLRVSRVSVWLLSRDRRRIRALTAYDRDDRRFKRPNSLSLDQYPHYARAIRAHRVVEVHDAATDERTRELADAYLRVHDVRSMLDARIPAGGDIAGILCCESWGQSREWRSDEAGFVASCAELLGQISLAHSLRAERNNLEARVIARTAELEAATRHAEAANVAKSQFLATMSHELRTPLNGIIGYSEIMRETAEDDGRSDDIADHNRVLGAARRLLHLINGVLDLSKIEAGRMELEIAPADIDQLLADALDGVRPQAEARKNRLRVERPLGAIGMARTDAFKLSQCLLNLMSNAAKFTEQGEIVLRAYRCAPDRLRFEVADTGIGIAPEKIGALFQPFVQADASTTRNFGGTGLGLVITRRIANLLGGDLSATSVPGAGSTFTLDITDEGAAAPGEADRPPDTATDAATDAALALVIDDDRDARDLAARILSRLHFAVREAATAEAGLALARALRPALIILDLHLPDAPGWDLLAALKRDAALAELRVIVVSVEDDRARALAMGACDLITKPADRERLGAAALRFARRPPHCAELDFPASPSHALRAG